MALKYSTISNLVLFLAIVIITTGVYSEFAYSQYVIFSLMLGMIIVSTKYRNYIAQIAKARILTAVLLSSLFFILILNSDFSFKAAITPTISLLVFCVFYYFAVASFQMNSEFTKKIIVWAIIASLLTIMYGQWLQSQGVVLNSQVTFTNEQISWQKRFGAFLNANQTGHIILMLLYSVIAIRQFKIYDFIIIISFVLVATILITIGSRAGFLFFGIILLILFLNNFSLKKVVFLSIILMVGLILFLSDFNSLELITVDVFGSESPFERIFRNLEYDERYYIILEAYESFLVKPIFGNGYRFLYSSIGFSAHNEIIENLTNFGLLFGGGIFALTGLLYKGHSRSAILICSPAFLFSHNFYDQPSIQAAIAIVLFSNSISQIKRF